MKRAVSEPSSEAVIMNGKHLTNNVFRDWVRPKQGASAEGVRTNLYHRGRTP